jgi:purine-binding chemotaxis protein CheW
MQTKINSEVNSYLSFRIGTETFAANVKNVLNILEMTKITSVPKAPGYMKGVINLRGSVLPVIDSRLKFNLEESDFTSNTCIVVLELHIGSEPIIIGTIVDAVKEVLEIEDNSILPPPSIGTSYRTNFLKGMYKSEDGFIMLLDAEKVFANEEIIDIQTITKEVDKVTA